MINNILKAIAKPENKPVITDSLTIEAKIADRHVVVSIGLEITGVNRSRIVKCINVTVDGHNVCDSHIDEDEEALFLKAYNTVMANAHNKHQDKINAAHDFVREFKDD